MKYTFVSLGRLESIGVRLGGAGLGNILFPWARAIVYAKNNNLQRNDNNQDLIVAYQNQFHFYF